MTFEETARVMPVIRASRKVERALALGDPKLGEYDEELRKAAQVYLERRRREDTAQETPDRKEGESMTQKEKYKRAASAMRKALVSIMSDGPSTEYRMRAARDEIQAALPYEDSDYWRADAPAEGIAETEEKKECAELTQEKYKKVALAMNKALYSIYRDDADVEDRLRLADAEIHAVQLSDKWGVPVALLPIEGISVEAEKLETEDEPDEDEAEKEKPTGKNAVQDVPETWQERMQCEYRETKARYEKLHRMVTKFEAGVLEFTPKSSIELLRQQKRHMGEYLHDLEIRGYVEGVEL